jgi:NADPH oxidase 5
MNAAEIRRFLGIANPYLARRLFAVLDDDRDGRVSEGDFLKSVAGLILGEDEDKLRFVFRLHDDDGDGVIEPEELDRMLGACLKHNRLSISVEERRAIRDALISKAGRNGLDFAAFRRLLAAHELVRRQLVQSVADWFGAEGGRALDVRHVRLATVVRQLVVVVPYYAWRVLLVIAYVGANGFFFWSAMSRYGAQGANLYVQIARGAGACLDFNGMLILVPMLRTLLTWIRRTFLFALIPVDHNVAIHKAVGHVIVFFSFVHSGAHLLNYTTLTRSLEDSLFRTTAGLSGVVLLGIMLIMWLFALPLIRRTALYGLFSLTHVLYWAWFAAALFHAHSFLPWAAAPVAGFLVELLIRRLHKRNLTFVKAGEALPTGVTHLELHRPPGFQFDAGEYVYLKIPRIGRISWHPFTISSNPEETGHIGLHVRALGNWTRRLHRVLGKLAPQERSMPAILQGPYGSPSTRIFASKHAVLVGAGIGVTPFASILRSIVARARSKDGAKPEKVYFFWLYRGQQTFEWFSELLEEIDGLRLKQLEINVCLTDARINSTTGLLKVGMDLVHGATRRDILTGLTARTSFGQPDWNQIFYKIGGEHSYGRVDVFFCGPYPLGRIVRAAARRAGFGFRMEQF